MTKNNKKFILTFMKKNKNNKLAEIIFHYNGEEVYSCYQCLKCSSGCPLASAMDYLPSQIRRLAQLGEEDLLLSSEALWLCTGCYTCHARCPNNINTAKVIDALKPMAVKKGCKGKKNIRLFHDYFIENIKKRGRAFEGEFLAKYQFMTGQIIKNALMGLELFLMGRISIFPESVEDPEALREIYRKVEEKKGKKCSD